MSIEPRVSSPCTVCTCPTSTPGQMKLPPGERYSHMLRAQAFGVDRFISAGQNRTHPLPKVFLNDTRAVNPTAQAASMRDRYILSGGNLALCDSVSPLKMKTSLLEMASLSDSIRIRPSGVYIAHGNLFGGSSPGSSSLSLSASSA